MNNLPLSLVIDAAHVAEQAAIACYSWIGRNDEKAADQAAVESMRTCLNKLAISGIVVIGEGERDDAPMLYIGEQVGAGGIELDIALDPLEGTTICAEGRSGAISTIAFASKGSFLHAPDVYMDKIIIGKDLPSDIISLDNSVQTNLNNLARAKKCSVNELKVTILARERHLELIAKVREAGAKVLLINDGDVAAAITITLGKHQADMYVGIGGAPEGVLAAAALKATKGQMLGRLIFDNDAQRLRAKNMGISDINQQFTIEQMAKGDVIFAASGVTSGSLLKGIKKENNQIKVHSLITSSQTQSIIKLSHLHQL